MNKNRIALGIPFLLAAIASIIYYNKGYGIGLIAASIFALLVAGLFGFAFAYGWTKDNGNLSVKEKNRAITIGVGTFSIVAALLMISSLFGRPLSIQYMSSYNHFFEMVLRIVVGITAGGLFFLGNFMLLSWLVPWTGEYFHGKINSLSTPAAKKKARTAKNSFHPMTILLIVISVLLVISLIFGLGSSSSTPPPVKSPVVNTTTPADPNAPIVLQDESGKINQ